jgi:predicted AlkP superfamily phosphohydrolase/phosphomutase
MILARARACRADRGNVVTEKRRVLVVAWDGATLDLLGPWSKYGNLPTIRMIMAEGTHGDLTSTYPPVTAPAWTSFMTGKSPGNHGVFDFFRRKDGSYSQVLNAPRCADSGSLWALLSAAGKKVGVMNVPLTYPPEPVNGFLISGLLTPRGATDWAYPQSLIQELTDNLGRYLIHHDEKYSKANAEDLLAEQHQLRANRTAAALYLMQAKEWDLFMVHYYGPDRMGHEFWHLLDPSHPQHDPVEYERFGNVVLDFFEKLDADLAELVSQLEENDVLILMSDHGMGRVTSFLNVNSWLLAEGFIMLRKDTVSRLRYALFRMGLNYDRIGRFVLRAGAGRQAVRIGRGRRQELQEKIFCSFRDVDWPTTRAYSVGNYGQIFVNLKGREPQGCVSPGAEYDQILEDLTDRLQRLVDPESGQTVIGKVFRKDDVYSGTYADRAPDLMFLTKDMEYKALGLSDFASPRILTSVFGCTGNHRMNGMAALYGRNVIKRGARLQRAGIQDLAPTILYLMGVPVPREMDGVALLDVFTEDFLREHQLIFSDLEGIAATPSVGCYTEEEEKDLVRHLRGLGYA